MADSADSATIPIVDFRDWGRGSITERRQIAKDLTEACRRVGFVYIVNHGVPDSLLQQSFDWAERLFGLPEEKKMLAPHPPGPSVHRGYSWPGLEKVSQYIHKEGEDADIEDAELRNVPDCKVRAPPFLYIHYESITEAVARRVTRSAAMSLSRSPTSGSQRTCYLAFATS